MQRRNCSAGGAARTETDAITLATMHSAKGLEFTIVHIDANEGITPHSRAMLDEDMGRKNDVCFMWQ